jgi:peptidoglycan-N-acetylmuramic acid deacetylase
MTQQLGYTSVFWSFAHVDYDEKHQPPVSTTVSRVLAGSHPGAIFLLHGISTSDTAALDEIIKGLRAQGYGFGTLEPR